MKQAAGILLFRRSSPFIEVFLVHPGGPLWGKKDLGVWSIPKGEFTQEEPPLNAAIREFEEETGTPLSGDFMPLTSIRQRSGKLVYAWALEGDLDPATVSSNTFKLEWPPKSGKWQDVPEIDKGEWFALKAAREKINPAQVALLNELEGMLGK